MKTLINLILLSFTIVTAHADASKEYITYNKDNPFYKQVPFDPSNAQSFLCIGERATGFKADNDYGKVSFKPGKYHIKQVDKKPLDESGFNDGRAWEIYSFGSASPLITSTFCESYSGNDDPVNDIYIICHAENAFIMDSKNLRFTLSFYGGFVNDNANTDMVMEVGKCSKL